ncbi:MAG: rRNA pseudouridine synthase [Blautia sp.]|nr:rRNA pseudouridine synthase [Blautia sp.]
MGSLVRLDRFLAGAGCGTRSEVKQAVKKGQVRVNGETAKAPDLKIDPDTDRILFMDEEVKKPEEFVYYLLNKPAGYLSATEDRHAPTVLDLMPGVREGVFPVGRLDKDTEGFLLMTDDGMLAHRLLSPARHVEKTYYARLDGLLDTEMVRRFEEGLDIGEKKPTLPALLEILPPGTEAHITLCEGKFHQVKRMFEAVGRKVLYLKRISMGGISLPEDLMAGEYRALTPEELGILKRHGRA